MHSRARTQPPARWALAILIAAMSMLAPFTIDTYLPSFPAIAETFGTSTPTVQLTLSGFLAGYAFMMLFHGALSDAYGRRPVVLVALGVFVAASAACAVAASLSQLVTFRVMQGLSGGAGMVVGRAVIRDLYEGPHAQKLMSMVTLVFALAPAAAPVLGGYLHAAFGWRSVFLFLVLYAGTLAIVCWRWLPETLPPSQRQSFRPLPLARAYRHVGANARFLMLSSAVGFNFCGFFVYIAGSPGFIYEVLGLAETDFGWLFIPGISGVVGGALLSGRMAGRVPPRGTVRIGYLLMGCAAAANVAGNALFDASLPWAVLPVAAYTLGMALAMPSITLLALDLFPHNRGMAASLQGFEHAALTALVAGAVAPAVSRSGLWLAGTGACLCAVGYACWRVYLCLDARAARNG